MPDGVMTVLFFVVIGVIYLVVSYVGNKIVDKGEDAIRNASKRRRNFEDGAEKENLADRYKH